MLVALFFINISLAYMDFKRIYEGKYLAKSQKQPSYLVSALDWLWARIISLILWPVHILAKKLVYNKIHSAIGISKLVNLEGKICHIFQDNQDIGFAGISGGGRLPSHVDKFFEAIGMKVQNGYGLTESSPVVAAQHRACNWSIGRDGLGAFISDRGGCSEKMVGASSFQVLGSIGRPLRHTEIRVVDSETGEVLPAGSKGIVEAKGPQVMKGYYKNESTTKQVLDVGGWLNTGDIGWIAPHHSIGRIRLAEAWLYLKDVLRIL
ncbi:hypothetical protein CsSME_00034173 [Camellia sinensis var. sinensis]